MKKIIYKYPISFIDKHVLTLPIDAKILSAIDQDDKLVIYIEQGISMMPKTEYVIEVVGTGQVFDSYMKHFFSTVKQGQYVWHLYWSRI